MRRHVSVSGFVLTLALLAWPEVAVLASTPSPDLISPCYQPPSLPEEKTNRVMYGVTGLSFGLPRDFVREIPGPRYTEGGIRWTDHQRTFEVVNGLWGDESFGKGSPRASSYSECVDSLAGIRFRLIVTSSRSSPPRYAACAVPLQEEGFITTPDGRRVKNWKYTLALIGESPVREDLKLFLSVFHSMRKIDR